MKSDTGSRNALSVTGQRRHKVGSEKIVVVTITAVRTSNANNVSYFINSQYVSGRTIIR
jgi:hypothetical protein